MTILEQDIIRHALNLYREKLKGGYTRVTPSTKLTANWHLLEVRSINEIERKLCMCGPIKIKDSK